MVEELHLMLLGHLEIRRGGIPVTGFASRKVQALLCYLAVTGQPHLRPALAGLLWGELPEASAQNSLRKALSNLRRLMGRYVTITRQTVALNPDSPYWLDVRAFEALAGGAVSREGPPQSSIETLEEAVELYRGDFLAGFYVRQAPAFEEWALAQRARLRELAVQTLHALAVHHIRRGEAGRPAAVEHTTSLLTLEPWREEAHRQLMLLSALDGQRGAALAQYETCRAVLARELGVEPGVETVRLYEQIRDDQLEPIPRLPRFLQEDVGEEEPPLFVAREGELARLDGFLAAVRAGHGQMIFVTGGPGRGKTALLAEFARRAMESHPGLLVASGGCDALSGAGDPYQPFREMLGMLTGDVEARWSAGSISTEHARRLWNALPLAAQALAERGPHVTGILVDGPALLSRATAATAPLTAPWLHRLHDRIDRQRAHGEGLQQSYLFEQVTNVLRRLARVHPLLLIIDDLQWADAASVGLLFHLGRRLRGSRILVACAYRPEEVIFGRDGARPGESSGGDREESHPLGKVLAEFKGQFGDVWVDLARPELGQDRAFVDAFLDSEPNRLGEGFRRALLARTAGHPLFTIELLRGMQERDELLQDDTGRWIMGPAVHWETLPARVEGAIEQRIGRLEPELRHILAVASVEGEEFTAQAVARTQGSEERRILHTLSEDLERQHRLVRARDEFQIGPHHLSRYRFAHLLFRDYLYRSLSPGERRLLHQAVGTALEDLHHGHTGEIAARLARHFAGDPWKERHYARLAGERAAAQYALEEAARHLGRALELTHETEPAERYALLLAREKVFGLQGDREAQKQDLEALQSVASDLADARRQAEVAVRRAQWAGFTDRYRQGIAGAKAAIELLRTDPDPELEAAARRQWAHLLSRLGENEAALVQWEEGLAQARAAGSRGLEAEILRRLGVHHVMLGDLQQAKPYLDESLAIFREVGDRFDEMVCLDSLSALYYARFEHQQAKEQGEKALRLSRELGCRSTEAPLLTNLAAVLDACGDYETAKDQYTRSLEIARELGDRGLEGLSLANLGSVALALNQDEKALRYTREALAILREIGHLYPEAYALHLLGRVLADLGELAEASAAYQEAFELRREMGLHTEAVESVAGLARVSLADGDVARAMAYVEEILSHLESGKPVAMEKPLLLGLTCYRVLQASDDPRATAVLEEAHQLLQEIAAKFTNEDLRRSFLEDVATHRELVQAYERVRGMSGHPTSPAPIHHP